MRSKLLAMIRDYRLIQPGDTVICAVSGGADSVALLFALYLMREKLQIRLEAAHFNHHLRGDESQRDEDFVRSFCDRYEIPLHVGGGQVQTGEKGLEAAARDARYAFLDTLDGKIATAHTADDNAETVLMHLVRGTGLKGLGGISPIRGKLIRPMLFVTREDVLGFVEEYHLPYVEDSSNDSDMFLRNRLRHHVMPLLKQENPRLSRNLSAMALRLREDEQTLSTEVDMEQGLQVAQLKAMSEALRARAIAAFLKQCGVIEPDRAHIAQTEALLYSDNPSARTQLPGNVTVCRRYDRLVLHRLQPPVEMVKLRCPGTTLLPEHGLAVHCYAAEKIINTSDIFTVSAGVDLTVRHRQTGDTIRLPAGTKSIKKLFIDCKIPADCRDSIPVVADENGILGICGIGANRDRIPEQLPAVQIRFEHYTPKDK